MCVRMNLFTDMLNSDCIISRKCVASPESIILYTKLNLKHLKRQRINNLRCMCMSHNVLCGGWVT